MRFLIVAAAAALLPGCVATKIVTAPVKVVAGAASTAADVVD